MKEYVAWLFAAGLVVNALLFIPQIIRIFKTKSAKSVSRVTFTGFCFFQIVSVFHGYYQGDTYLMWGMLVSFGFCLPLTILAYVYRKQ